jgi:hypothetical protein
MAVHATLSSTLVGQVVGVHMLSVPEVPYVCRVASMKCMQLAQPHT